MHTEAGLDITRPCQRSRGDILAVFQSYLRDISSLYQCIIYLGVNIFSAIQFHFLIFLIIFIKTMDFYSDFLEMNSSLFPYYLFNLEKVI